MAEEVTIFVRPNENYTYRTPFQTINIVQMSEDEQDDPDPEPITYDFVSPLTAYGIDPDNLTLETSITTTESTTENSFWYEPGDYIAGGTSNQGASSKKKSIDNFDCSRNNIKILKFGNILIECGGIYFYRHYNLFLPTFTDTTPGEITKHTLTFVDTLTWGLNRSWPSNITLRPIYDKSTDTLYGVKETSQSLLETELSGHELIYCENSSSTTPLGDWKMKLDNNQQYSQIVFADRIEGTVSYYIKMPHASRYITNIQNL